MATFSTRTRIRTSRVLNVRLESTIKDTELPALLHNLIVDGGKFLYSKSNGHIILEVTRISNTVPLNPRGRQPDNRSRCVRSEHTLASPLCTCVAHCGTACSPSTTWACASAASWSCLDYVEGAGRREKPPRTPTLFNFYEGTTDPLRLNFRSEKGRNSPSRENCSLAENIAGSAYHRKHRNFDTYPAREFQGESGINTVLSTMTVPRLRNRSNSTCNPFSTRFLLSLHLNP
jgi:hypothetical protein